MGWDTRRRVGLVSEVIMCVARGGRDGIGVPRIRKGLRMLAMYLSNWLAYSLGEAGTGVPGWKSAVHACVRDVVAFLGCLVWHGVILG